MPARTVSMLIDWDSRSTKSRASMARSNKLPRIANVPAPPKIYIVYPPQRFTPPPPQMHDARYMQTLHADTHRLQPTMPVTHTA